MNSFKTVCCLVFFLCLAFVCTSCFFLSRKTSRSSEKSGNAVIYTEEGPDLRTRDCIRICGPGFKYDRPGDKLGGREIVCTRYPYSCGYSCTTGWNIETLKNGTEFTCQTAIQ